MDKKMHLKPLAAALGTTFAVSLAASPIVNAADNPFAATEFRGGYMVAEDAAAKSDEQAGTEAKSDAAAGDESASDEAKAGEGKCGGSMDSDAKGGEGKCGS